MGRIFREDFKTLLFIFRVQNKVMDDIKSLRMERNFPIWIIGWAGVDPLLMQNNGELSHFDGSAKLSQYDARIRSAPIILRRRQSEDSVCKYFYWTYFVVLWLCFEDFMDDFMPLLNLFAQRQFIKSNSFGVFVSNTMEFRTKLQIQYYFAKYWLNFLCTI